MGRYTLSAAARDDLSALSEYLREAAGIEVARAVVEKLQSRCQTLAELPGTLGTPRDELRPGVRSLPAAPYVIFFRYREAEVQIIRVLHERQDVRQQIESEEE